MGFEGESELRSDQPCRRRVSKGDELNKAAPAPPAPPPAPAAPAPAVGENGVRPTDEPRTPPAGEGAEAGAGDPALCRARRLLSQAAAAMKNHDKASMSLSNVRAI